MRIEMLQLLREERKRERRASGPRDVLGANWAARLHILKEEEKKRKKKRGDATCTT